MMHTTIAACANCNLTKWIEAKGLCNACYRYQLRTGQPRPKKWRVRQVLCELCRLKPARSKGLCHRCYEHRRINGVDRPLYLRNVNLICSNPNCDKPLSSGRNRVGCCNACYHYRHDHGNEDRPIRLCRR